VDGTRGKAVTSGVVVKGSSMKAETGVGLILTLSKKGIAPHIFIEDPA
jgi:hypothetical protein